MISKLSKNLPNVALGKVQKFQNSIAKHLRYKEKHEPAESVPPLTELKMSDYGRKIALQAETP